MHGELYAYTSTRHILKALGLTGGVTTTRDGQPGNQSDRRVDHIIPPQALQQGTYSLIIEVSCNGMFGVPLGGYRYQTPDVSHVSTLLCLSCL